MEIVVPDTSFTPITAITGGLMIGAAALFLLAALGRIAGISGILAGVLPGPAGAPREERPWRLAFLAGLLTPAALLALFGKAPAVIFPGGPALLLAAGLLVGIGTRLGSGCTSGHGVCGMARLSPRSFAATAIFMAAGFLTVFLTRHVL
jgi:uncharacterized membrane protein YedE/YeeE